MVITKGVKAIGRHARTIRLGRALWQSPPLAEHVTSCMQERFFDDGTFPPLKEVEKALSKAKKTEEDRPAPFAGKTQPWVHLSVVDYGKRLRDWLDTVRQENEAPTTEQLGVLTAVADRVLLEFRLEKEGLAMRSWKRKSSRLTPLFFPGHNPSPAKRGYRAHFSLLGKCCRMARFPEQVHRKLPLAERRR